MRIMVVGGMCCVLAACQSTAITGTASPVLKTGTSYAVVGAPLAEGITINGGYYSRATRAEAMDIAVTSGLLSNRNEAERAFADKSDTEVLQIISVALAVEGAYARAEDLRRDILDGLSGKEIRQQYTTRVEVLFPNE